MPAPVENKSCKAKCQDFLTFLYDKKNHTFCGRKCDSWAKILLFYLIFYTVLAGFFIGFLYGYLSYINDPRMPKYSHGLKSTDSPILHSPGISSRPRPEATSMGDSSAVEIHFDKKDPKSYSGYVKTLQNFLKAYDKPYQRRFNVTCTTIMQNSLDCVFSRNELNVCDGKTDPNFGYDKGEPCILLKINKIINWVPKPFNSENDIGWASPHTKFVGTNVGFSCSEEDERQKVLKFPVSFSNKTTEFFPNSGILGQCFPYCNETWYRQPIVMVKLRGIPVGKVVYIRCLSWASNIVHHPRDKAVYARFQIKVKQ